MKNATAALGWALLIALVLASANAVCAQTAPAETVPLIRQQPLTIPAIIDGKRVRLEAGMYRPSGPGPFPLVIFNHGTSSRNPAQLRLQRPDYQAASSWFVSRGFLVIIPMRRGYGRSDGPVADLPMDGNTGRTCANPDYRSAGEESARDVLAVLDWARARSDVDASRVILAGHSAGGWAVVAAMSQGPPVLGGIIFAGGRGGNGRDFVCRPSELVAAARDFGVGSRLPTIWLYGENDHFFGPKLARAMFDAFTAPHPSLDTFVALPAYGRDGHQIIDSGQATYDLWTPPVETFLRSRAR